ncbi:MAG: site-2 protease family protein [Promethearchaeota archaeon]
MFNQLLNAIVDFILNPFFIIAVLFWVGIFVLVLVLGKLEKSKALSVFFPFLAMVKTKRLNKLLKKIALISPRLWKIIFTVGIFVSFAFTIYGFYYFTNNLVILIFSVSTGSTPPPEAQLAPLVPGLTIDFQFFMYLIIPILFVLTSHELGHAISANADGIPVKSTGVFGMGVFFIIGFGAFVEVDERRYKRGRYSGWQKARLAGAGSFVNSILAVIALLMIINFPGVIALSHGNRYGAYVRQVTPAADGGHVEGVLFHGDVIMDINGTPLSAQAGYTLSSFLYYNVTQNDTLECTILRGGVLMNVTFATGPPPNETGYNQSIAFIGVQTEFYWPPRNWLGRLLGGTFPNTLSIEIYWTFVIAISVTLFNMLPLVVFDGDKVVYEILNHFIKSKPQKKNLKESIEVRGKDFKLFQFRPVQIEVIEKIVMHIPLDNGEYEQTVLEEFKDYQLVDSNGDGVVDHATFEIREESIPTGAILEAEYSAIVDAKKKVKNTIMNIIRFATLTIIALNFIISGLTIGFTLPFIG